MNKDDLENSLALAQGPAPAGPAAIVVAWPVRQSSRWRVASPDVIEKG
jgi:hypothetical protein